MSTYAPLLWFLLWPVLGWASFAVSASGISGFIADARALPIGPARRAAERVLNRVGLATPPVLLVLSNPTVNALGIMMGKHAPAMVFTSELLTRLAPRQVKVIAAHELGHVFHRHGQRNLLHRLSWLGLLFVALFLTWTEAHWSASVALFGLYALWWEPAQRGARHRAQELQADAFAAALCGHRVVADVLSVAAFDAEAHWCHPPLAERLARLDVRSLSDEKRQRMALAEVAS